ncbi:Fic family protein [bacterium]|nr:Fic family protein [bacterium]
MESLYNVYYNNKEKYNELYQSRFNSENAIKFNFKIGDNYAFFFFHQEIMNIIYTINRLNNEVTSILEKLPTIAQKEYKKRSLIDEILYTNDIEGVISTRKEISEIIDDIKQNNKNNNRIYSLVNKYLMLSDNNDYILDLEDIRKAYDELVLSEIDKGDYPDGELFRKNLVYVKNNSGKIIHTGVLPEKIDVILLEGLSYLNDDSIDPFIRCAIFHYIFSFVHPFYDGNGRLDRYITSLYLKKYYNPIISFRLSLTIKEKLSDYYEAFKKTNDKHNKGDITTFVYTFIDIIKEAFIKTKEYLNNKNTILYEKNEILKKLVLDNDKKQDTELKEILFILYQVDIFGEKGINRRDLSKEVRLSIPTLSKLLKTLEEKEYVKKAKENNAFIYSLNIDRHE